MELCCYGPDGEEVGMRLVSLPRLDGNFGLAAFHRVVVGYQRNARQGDAQAKTRSEVSGSGKKPYRQKGTSMARHGEKRSPIWTGGGVVFGPRHRDHGVKINRKARLLALAKGLNVLAADGSLLLVEGFAVPERPKTRDFLRTLRRLRLEDNNSVLLVDESFAKTTELSARNLPQVSMVEARTLNAWDVARCEKLVASERAMAVLSRRMAMLRNGEDGPANG